MAGTLNVKVVAERTNGSVGTCYVSSAYDQGVVAIATLIKIAANRGAGELRYTNAVCKDIKPWVSHRGQAVHCV